MDESEKRMRGWSKISGDLKTPTQQQEEKRLAQKMKAKDGKNVIPGDNKT